MIDKLSLIYSHIKSPYDIHSLMTTNNEFYSLSEKWRNDNWSYYGIPLMPWQVNLKHKDTDENFRINFPSNHQLSILQLCKGKPTIILVNNKNMKAWIEIIKSTRGLFDEDSNKTQVLINHVSQKTHYSRPDKSLVFKRTGLLITTPSGLSSIENIENIKDGEYMLVYDIDASDVAYKYQKNAYNIRLTSFDNAKYKYIKRSENFIPDVNVIYTEPDQSVQDVLELFKEKKSVYIATGSNMRTIAGYNRGELTTDAFYDDEGGSMYIDNASYDVKYLPCDNIIIHLVNEYNILELTKKYFPQKRNIEVVIIQRLNSYVNSLLAKHNIKIRNINNDDNLKMLYGLCCAFGCDIKTLNKCELTLLFGKYGQFMGKEWKIQTDNKFTKEQVRILKKMRSPY